VKKRKKKKRKKSQKGGGCGGASPIGRGLWWSIRQREGGVGEHPPGESEVKGVIG
jgi:hypothetical protein